MRRILCLLSAAALLSGCSAAGAGSKGSAAPSPLAPVPSPSATPSATRAYVDAVLADHPLGLWELTDVAGARAGDAVADSSPNVRDAELVEGGLATTPGPFGAVAGRFTGKGRIVTPLVNALRPGRPFTIEFFFRPDDCTRHWTQVAGTAGYDAKGREGVNVLHYPRFFPTGCHLAVEFWNHNAFTGGCGPPAVVATGRWLHFAAAYDGHVVRCYAGGRLVGQSAVPGFGTGPAVPFGIGGAGTGYAGTLDSGSLADVAVYGRALSAQAVHAHAVAR